MNLRRQRENLKVQILDTERLAQKVAGHPVMGFSLNKKLEYLKQELDALPVTSKEPSITLLFSGQPVVGSAGIDATFISKAILPFQKMVHADLVQRGYGKVGMRGQLKNAYDAKLFLTALPRGSFGIELSKIENSNLFDEGQVSDSLAHVSNLIASSAKSDEDFAASLDNIPHRTLSGLRQFLKIVSDDKAGVVVESGGIRASLEPQDVVVAYNRVAETTTEQKEIQLKGTLKGILLESWRFDFISEEGQPISGSLGSNLTEETAANLVQSHFNKNCTGFFDTTTVFLKSGRVKEIYVLKSLQ
ncbi:MAG: hypothetical protein ACK5PC_07790 [Cyclobacteriaceae bacterium]